MASGHIVLTGAAGFIGSHLARRFRAEGFRVVGIDSRASKTTNAEAGHRLAELGNDPGFDLADLDLTDRQLGGLVRGAQAIFHFAARPGSRDADRQLLHANNVLATEAVIAAAEAAGVADLVFASSSSVYGTRGERQPCRERDHPAPISAYAETKLAAERLLRRSSLNFRVVRLFTVYGPDQRSDMAFARFIEAALDDRPAPLFQALDAKRDFTYVSDAVEGALRAWQRGSRGIYNISGGASVALGSAIELLSELLGTEVPLEQARAPGEPVATLADLSHSRSELGYEPRVALPEGLREQVAERLCAGSRAHRAPS